MDNTSTIATPGTTAQVSETAIETFISTMTNLSKEDLITRSPRGKKVGYLISQLQKEVHRDAMASIATCMSDLVEKCILAGNQRKLASASQAVVWQKFHQLRNLNCLKGVWQTFISANVPQAQEVKK